MCEKMYKHPMQYYPLFLDISSRYCLVVGAGGVGRRKIATLLKAGAQKVFVVDEYLSFSEFQIFYSAEFLEENDLLVKEVLSEHACFSRISYIHRPFQESDIDGMTLVFAATSDSELNGHIADLCKKHSVFCNVIENIHRGDFIVPSHVNYDNLVLALSTSGTSPALAKALKKDLGEWLDTGYVPFLAFMAQVRKIMLSDDMQEIFQHPDRTKLFRSLVEDSLRGKILALLKAEKKAELQELVKQNVPSVIFEKIDWNEIV